MTAGKQKQGVLRSRSVIERWLFPDKVSEINTGYLNETVTVISTYGGRTSIDSEELVKSTPVQEFIREVVPKVVKG
ncbi:MAG: hypothetical protein ACK5AZ_15160 [Bryobacteraceae bacterium]